MSIDFRQFKLENQTVEQVLDFLPYPFLVAENRNGVFFNIFVNKKFIQEIGYTIEQIPTRLEWFSLAYPDAEYREAVNKAWDEKLNEAIEKEVPNALMKVKITTKNTGDKWFEVKSSIIGTIQLVAFINIHEETTLREELQRLNENKNHTLSILTHDIRGPISNLHMLSKMAIHEMITPEEFVRVVRAVNDKSRQVLEFIDTTLLWTRSNFEGLKISIKEIDLTEVVDHILQVYEGLCEQKTISITSTLHEKHCTTDREIIHIVLRNLVSNAIKFTPEKGHIHIVASKLNNSIYIAVRDNGTGMDQASIHKLLDSEYHSSYGTHNEKGLGMGIKLCQKLLKQINGKLEMESEIGKGMEVRIVLGED